MRGLRNVVSRIDTVDGTVDKFYTRSLVHQSDIIAKLNRANQGELFLKRSKCGARQ